VTYSSSAQGLLQFFFEVEGWTGEKKGELLFFPILFLPASFLSAPPVQRETNSKQSRNARSFLPLLLPSLSLKTKRVGTERGEEERTRKKKRIKNEKTKKSLSPDVDVGVAEVPVRVRLAGHAVVSPGADDCLDAAVDEVVEGLDVLADEAPDLFWGWGSGKKERSRQ
jgi:hypothetical protein